MEVVEKIAQQRDSFAPRVGEPARVGAYLRVVMAQEIHDSAGREFGPEPSGGGGRLPQTWSLNHPLGDQPGHRLCRIRAADHDERIEGGRLFGNYPIDAETREALTQGFEGGYRCMQPAPSRLGGQSKTIAEAGIEDRPDQVVIIQGVTRDDRPGRAAGRKLFRRPRACAKEIELLGSHHLPLGYPARRRSQTSSAPLGKKAFQAGEVRKAARIIPSGRPKRR
jgi:hypothetical protein